MPKFLRALLLGCLLLSASRGARAEAEPVQVLAIQSEHAVAQAHALTEALKRAVQLDANSVLAPGEYALEVLLVALGCPEQPDAPCLSRIAGKVGSERFIWGSAELDDDVVLVELHLWSHGAQAKAVRFRFGKDLVRGDDEALLSIAQRAYAKLSAAPSEPVPPPVPSAPPVAPEASHHRARPALSSKPAAPELHESAAPVGGWALLGAGVAALGGGAYSALRVHAINGDDGFRRYRDGLAKSQDACDQAESGQRVEGAPSPESIRSQCTTGHRFQVLEYVLFALGGVGVAAGGYWILSHDSKPVTARRMAPSLAVDKRALRVAVEVVF